MLLDYRLTRFREWLQAKELEAFLVQHPVDLFYLTGLDLSAGKILVTEQESFLCVDGRYIESALGQSLYSAALQTPSMIKEWLTERSIKRLGFDANHTSYSAFQELESQLSPEIKLVAYDSPVQNLRMIKEAGEIVRLKEAAKLAVAGTHFVMESLREGVTEKELAIALEVFWLERGGEKLAFDPIIAFGANSSKPHYRAGDTILKSGMPVLIDIGVVKGHYASDMTRTVFFGHPPDEIKKIYAIVEEAKKRAEALCRPGVSVGELDAAARDYIASFGYGDQFSHSLGHGIGLDTHEPPILRHKGKYHDLILKTGMVITIEPGIYLPGIGGVRLEDTVLITEGGCEILT